MRLSEHRNHQILKETQLEREKTPYKHFHVASGSVAAVRLLVTFLCTKCHADKRTPSAECGKSSQATQGSSKDTNHRNIKLHGENISKPTSSEHLKIQASASDYVMGRKLCKPEMLPCPATSQTLA